MHLASQRPNSNKHCRVSRVDTNKFIDLQSFAFVGPTVSHPGLGRSETGVCTSFTNFWGNGAIRHEPGFRRMLTNPRTTAVSSQVRSIVLGIGISLLFAMPATAADLIVRYDQSQLLRLPRPASEIIVGNPSIADVALQDGNLLVVTGKTFGITNIIALDTDHNIIQDQRVMVERDDNRIVNLHKGSERFTYACTPNCEPTLTIGDEKDFFKEVESANSSKIKFSSGTSDQGNSANNAQ
ncbi:conserved protein of unknown function [Hyphomicrobium sp. MC1]|nr:conserved protein of unknown function [Hyphomicrobium sp. MC1]